MLAGASILIGLAAVAFESGPLGIVALAGLLVWLWSKG